MAGKTLVIGATGNVGREVVKALVERGQRVVAAVTDAADPQTPAPGADTVLFDFGRPETFPEALAGVQKVFLMRPPQIADVERYIHPFIDAAKTTGVQHIVFLSLMGVNPRVPHYQVEQKVVKAGVPYTFLRPSFFMQNLETFYRDDICERSELFVPAGRARTSFVDVRDIGAAAGLVFTQDGHLNRAYTLTGSAALDYYEVADLLTEALRRRIIYTRPTPQEYAAHQRALGTPEEFIKVMRSLYWTVRLGIGAKVTPDLGKLLGRPPITMAQYACDFADRFSAPAPEKRTLSHPLPGVRRPNLLRPLVELLQ